MNGRFLEQKSHFGSKRPIEKNANRSKIDKIGRFAPLSPCMEELDGRTLQKRIRNIVLCRKFVEREKL